MNKDDFKILDLTFHHDLAKSYDIDDINPEFKGVINHQRELLLSYLITWPLVFSTSIICKNDDAKFKPEYIIPQLLLQWVHNEHDIDGIMFNSTRINDNNVLNKYINYVFPPKRTGIKGYCSHLMDKIMLTDPISWQNLQLYAPHMIYDPIEKEDIETYISGHPEIFHLENQFGTMTNYLQTPFGRMEIALLKMSASKLEHSDSIK